MSAIDYPPVFINNYLSEKISTSLPNYFSNAMKFFPTQPTSIDIFTEEFPESAEEPFAVYDRMFRMRRGPFPHVRGEQILYYFYKTAGGIEALIESTQKVADLLDNGNESAEDVNAWIAEKHNAQSRPSENGRSVISFSNKQFFLPYFHEFKVYQLEESRDIIDFGTSRTYAANKLIIDYIWHKTV